MKIALIGGAGFIGHHLALRLRQRHDVLIADSLAVNNKYTVSGNHDYARMIDERLDLLHAAKVPVACVDARDYHILSNILGLYAPDIIVHLAAVAHIDRSNKDPFTTFDHNLRTLENALDLAKGIGCKHFVFFSSSTVYGDFQKPVVDETEPCNPKGIYGSLKYAGELLVRAYSDVYGLPWSIVRPCALYGPRCISGRVIQSFIEKAFAGDRLKLAGDGTGTVDFTYIDDLIQGVEKVIEAEAAKGEVFNITAGKAESLNTLISIFKAHFPNIEVTRGPLDPQRPIRGTMSVDKAKRLLGYAPRFDLETGVARYVEWYKGFSKKKTAA